MTLKSLENEPLAFFTNVDSNSSKNNDFPKKYTNRHRRQSYLTFGDSQSQRSISMILVAESKARLKSSSISRNFGKIVIFEKLASTFVKKAIA